VPYVEASIRIECDPEEAYELAREMERFPEYMPDVESVKVISREPNKTITEWVTNVEGTPIIWTEEDNFDDSALVINYRLIEGDLDKFDGTWSFKHDQGATLVVLGVNYDFGIPTLTDLIGPTLDMKVRENSMMMLDGMKRQIESRGK